MRGEPAATVFRIDMSRLRDCNNRAEEDDILDDEFSDAEEGEEED